MMTKRKGGFSILPLQEDFAVIFTHDEAVVGTGPMEWAVETCKKLNQFEVEIHKLPKANSV